MFSSENVFSMGHEFCYRVCTISDALLELCGDEGDGLCLVEAQTAS